TGAILPPDPVHRGTVRIRVSMGGAWGTREPLTATHLPFHGTQVHGSGFFPLALLGASPARAGASRGRAPTLFDRPWPPHRPKRVPNRKYATCPEVFVGGPRLPVSGRGPLLPPVWGRHDEAAVGSTAARVVGLSRPLSAGEDRVHEDLGVEGCQVVGALPQADEFDGHTQFPLDLHDDAAFGRAVQLGQRDTGDIDDFAEHPGLAETVLSGG